jgi:hypothetical protein
MSCHAVTCWLVISSVLFQQSSARFFPHPQCPQRHGVLVVEQYLASHSYLTCQNVFKDTFLYSSVPDKSTVSRLVNRFRHSRNSSPGCVSRERGECINRWTRWTFATLHWFLFLFSYFGVIYLTGNTCQEIVTWRLDHSLHLSLISPTNAAAAEHCNKWMADNRRCQVVCKHS